MSPSEAAAPAVDLLLDRFVSATTVADVVHSIQELEQAVVKSQTVTSTDITSEVSVVQAMLALLQEGQSFNEFLGTSVANQEEPMASVLRMYTHMVDDPMILQEPSPGRLLEAVLDVACGSSSRTTGTTSSSTHPDDNTYTRILAIRLLRELCQTHPRVTQNQLLQAPNGIHRLGDLLLLQDEKVRNEALLLAQIIAQWPSAAKIWMFSEMGDTIMKIVMNEGGLTNGNVWVQDSLRILHHMLQHDAALADLVFQSSLFTQSIVKLLDMRYGHEFLHPSSKSTATDDLDELLGDKPKQAVLPRLKPSEEKVIHLVFDILSTVMENQSIRQMVWTKQTTIASLVWEMGLFYLPPSHHDFAFAIPSVNLQQRALQITAQYFHDFKIMNQHNGLDRLNLLACTGGTMVGESGVNDASYRSLEDRMRITQSALHVIRRTLPPDQASEMMMHAMAPPMEGESKATAVQRLLGTVFENMSLPSSQEKPSGEALQRRKVFLAGSLGAVSLFLTDEASRSILLRLTTPNNDGGDSLIHKLLDQISSESDTFVAAILLRFLIVWVTGAPIVVQAMLSSPHSFDLVPKLTSPDETLSALSSVLLGLCLEYMGDDESKCGGWTRESIVDVLQKQGIGKFHGRLEKFKHATDLPWSYCELESAEWLRFYSDSVLVVKKRLVKQLTSTEAEGESNSEEPVDRVGADSSSGVLRQMLVEQSTEIERLNGLLRSIQDKASRQGRPKSLRISILFRIVSPFPQRKNLTLSKSGSRLVQPSLTHCS